LQPVYLCGSLLVSEPGKVYRNITSCCIDGTGDVPYDENGLLYAGQKKINDRSKNKDRGEFWP
jgi:hypothetical protein